MMKLIFLALVSTAFCGIFIDEAEFDPIAEQLGDDTIHTKVPTKSKVLLTKTKVVPTEPKVDFEAKVFPVKKVETIYKEIVAEMKKRTEFNILKTTLETMLINQIANILTLDLTEVKQIKTMLVNKGLNPKEEHLTSLLKLWLELPTTTKTITPKTNVVHDTEMTGLLSRWNVMSQKLFELTKKLSLAIKECKFLPYEITGVVKDISLSRSLLESIRNKEVDNCLAPKTQELRYQLFYDNSVHDVDMFLAKSFLTIYMKEVVAPDGVGLTQYYEKYIKGASSLKKMIIKEKLPFYVTLDVVYNVCRGHSSMYQDKIPSEVAKVTTEVCRYASTAFEGAKFVYYLYKEQLN